jgi:small subunit ribosomal protein S8
MTTNDPIADMLTRIRNALMVKQPFAAMPSSRIKLAIAQILREEGFIEDFQVTTDTAQPFIRIKLKYVTEQRNKRPVITGLERVSKPGRRVYTRRKDMPRVLSGMGVAILSTPKGVMTSDRARKLGVGGEVICRVW